MKWNEILKEFIEAVFKNDKFLVVVGVIIICAFATNLPKNVPQQTLTILNSALSGLFGFVTGTYVGKITK